MSHHQTHPTNYITHQQIMELEQKFTMVCLKCGGSVEYCQMFLASLGLKGREQLKEKVCAMANQINLLRKGQSQCQIISSLLKEREEVLRSLRDQLITNRTKKQLDLSDCCEQLGHIRMYNLRIIESVHALLVKQGVACSQYSISIFYHLLLNMDFLRTTPLRKYIQFSNMHDPLLLLPQKHFLNAQEGLKNQQKPISQLFSLDEAYLKRLRKANRVFKAGLAFSHHQRRHTENEMDDRVPASIKQLDSSFNRSEKASLPALPRIGQRVKNEVKDRRRSYSVNTLHDIIQDYEKRKKIKKKYDSFILNEVKTKKRTLNLPRSQSHGRVQSTQSKKKLSSKLLYIDDDNSHHPSSLSRISSSQNIKVPPFELLADIKQTQKEIHSESRQSCAISPHQQQSSNKNQNADRVEDNVVAKVKSSKYKRSKVILNRVQSSRWKQTVTNQFSTINEREQITVQKPYLSSKVQSLYGYERQHKTMEIKTKLQRIQKLSGITNSNKHLQLFAENDAASEESKYRIPIDILQQTHQKEQIIIQAQPKQQQYIIKKRQPQIKNKNEQRQPINIKIKNQQDNTQIVQKYASWPKRQLTKLSFSSMNINEKIQGDSRVGVKIDKSFKIQQQPFQQKISSKQQPLIPYECVPIFKQQTKQNLIVSQFNLSSGAHSNLNQVQQNQPMQRGNQIQSKKMSYSSPVCDVIYITPPNNKSPNNPPNDYLKNASLISSKTQQSSIRPIEKSRISASPYQNIFLISEDVQIEEQMLKRERGNASVAQKNEDKPSYTKQQTSILKKCIFQSKSFQEQEIMGLIKSYNSTKGAILFDIIRNNSYFTNRHIILSTCSFKDEVISYCFTSPYLTPQSRYIFMLHLELLNQKFVPIVAQLFSTFIKYILYNDPADKLIYLNFKDLFDNRYVSYFQEIKSYSGPIKTPLKSSNFDDISYLFQRKDLKCNKSEEFTTVFNTVSFVLTSTEPSKISLSLPSSKQLRISATYLKKVESLMASNRLTRKFAQMKDLMEYLQRQRLPPFRQFLQKQQLSLYEMLLQDCLTNAKYFVYSNYFYFTVEPPHCYFSERQEVYYLLLSTSLKNHYYLIADKIYEESEHIDLYRSLRDSILNKRMTEVFGSEKMRGRVVGCPKFQKKVEFAINANSSGMVMFELNWRDYLNGVKYLRQEAIAVQFIGPFLCALVEIREDNIIKHIYSTIVQRECIHK